MEENGEDIVVYNLTDLGKKRENNEDSMLYRELRGRGGSSSLDEWKVFCTWRIFLRIRQALARG